MQTSCRRGQFYFRQGRWAHRHLFVYSLPRSTLTYSKRIACLQRRMTWARHCTSWSYVYTDVFTWLVFLRKITFHETNNSKLSSIFLKENLFLSKKKNLKSARLTDLKENFSTHKERILHVPSSVESKTTLECTGGKSFWRWSTYQSHRKRWRPRRSLWCSSGSGCGTSPAQLCPCTFSHLQTLSNLPVVIINLCNCFPFILGKKAIT